ncbi:4-nitrophenylphosphatase [Harpegnathos saltator]|uniref:4-nitrophenylphosphatase n=2 Tax=Harpegnathos saltator TaxID=610380 RepID=E2BMW8_HARSA|nr:4-nitrophenylphosphatase [Harpegnathos saltator]
MALAISCLKREEVIYLTGAPDVWLGDKQKKVLALGPIIDLISKCSGKKPTTCCKPGQILKDYILNICNISNPQRCLFIGDTIQQDMKFASICGFTKLFVETGNDTLEDVQEEDTRPDYYISSLGQLFTAFKETQKQHTTNHEI